MFRDFEKHYLLAKLNVTSFELTQFYYNSITHAFLDPEYEMDYMPKEGNYEHHSWFSSENYIDFKTQTTRMSE